MPTLVTESGRAITAHHSVLIVPVLAAQSRDELSPDDQVLKDSHESLKGLADVLAALPDLTGTQELLEAFHDAKERQADIRSLFMLGYIGLGERALHVVERGREPRRGRDLGDPVAHGSRPEHRDPFHARRHGAES